MIGQGELGSSGVSPQWVMLGAEITEATWPDEWAEGHRYMVLGSDTPGRATVETVMAFVRERGPDGYARTKFQVPETTLEAKLGTYTLAFGATYAEALANLMSEWSPAGEAPEYRELTGAEIPEHLRDDAPSQQCDRCHRHTWDRAQFGQPDRMTQPNGRPCGGTFR